MINVLASVHIKHGHLAEFIKIFKANVSNVLEEDGCIEYAPTVDAATSDARQELDPNLVTVIEKWTSLEALQAHGQAPHMLAYGETVKGMIEKVTLKILQVA
ncbi:MAG: putative quinol monooxygenase [Propionivibrio sp.]